MYYGQAVRMIKTSIPVSYNFIAYPIIEIYRI